MGLTKLGANLNNIQALSDKPNETDGLTSAQLKEKFDKAGNDIKSYINNTLTSEIDTSLSTVSGSVTTLNTTLSGKIGTLSNLNTTAQNNLVAAINEVNTKVTDTGWQNLSADYGTWSYLKYRKIGNRVTVKGRCESFKFNGSTYKNIGTMPSGYRPTEMLYLLTPSIGRTLVRYVFESDGKFGIDWGINIADGSYKTDSSWTEFYMEYYID